MGTYEWILFDADETLFRFDAFRGLQLMFSRFDVIFTEQDYLEYERVNKPLWVDYQSGHITAQQLQHRRFRRFQTYVEKLQLSTQDLQSAFMAAMVEICTPLEGAISLLQRLSTTTKLGIITNGFAELQHARLERTGLKNHFEILVISEEVGVAKPHAAIFEQALLMMGNPDRNQVLMVGDNPDSDILGGNKAGLKTCWLNVDKRPAPTGITPHYQVSSLTELEKLLFDPAR